MAAPAQHVAAVRAFNRFYTRQVGALGEHLLDSPYSLTEMRVLYELAHRDDLTATDLGHDLGLDAGYLSRILRRFEAKGLLRRTASPADARRNLVHLTRRGRNEFAPYEERTRNDVGALLGRLSTTGQRQVVDAMQTIQRALATPPAAPAYVLRPHQPGDMGWVVQRHGELYAREWGYNAQFDALAAVQISVQARAVEPGELVVLTIALPEHRDAVRVRAFDRDAAAFAVDDRRWRALVGIDLDVKPGAYLVTVEAGAGLMATTDLVVARHRFPTRRLTVDEGFVNPPRTLTDRITQEAALLGTTWQQVTPERLWSAPFVRPVPQPANSQFGTRSVFNGRPRGAHGGADFPSPAGTPIRAPNAGRVVIARDLYFTGNTVVIDHGLGIFSMLAHLSAMDVREGDRVEADAAIGRVGA